MFNSLSTTGNFKRLMIIGGSVLGVILVISFSVALIPGTFKSGQSQSPPPDKNNQIKVSSLLFGTNLDLLNGKNQIFTSNSTYTALQAMHLSIIRIPVQPDASDAALQKALQTVKGLGAVPLIDLRGVVSGGTKEQTLRIAAAVGQIFSTNTIYYEIGNEEDLYGFPVDRYAAAWNDLVPVLKQKTPQAKFVGPVTYHYDANYLKAFLQKANPRPDAISWHEYACEASTTKDKCIQRLDSWSQDITNARHITQGVTGKALPIMITEWNYAPDATANDDKITDSEFMNAWTSQALQTLVNNQVYAAMQFSAVGNTTPLVDAQGTLTAQGTTLQSFYQSLASQQPSPTAVEPTATPTASPSPTPTATPWPTNIPGNPTATPRPTAKPTPPPDPNQTLYTQITSGTPFYASSLAGQDGGKWFIYTYSLNSKCFFEQGGYGVYVPNDVSSLICRGDGIPMYASFGMQVDMTITGGKGTDGGGPAFFDKTVYDNARLQVRVNGAYVLYDNSTVLLSGSSTALKKGLNVSNRVTIIVRGGWTYLYFNGHFVQKVAHAYKSSGSGGYSLYARHNESSTNVVFKNIKLWHA